MKKIFNIKIFNILILFLMICSCIFITGCKQKEVTEEEMEEWLKSNWLIMGLDSNYPTNYVGEYGIYKKPQITMKMQYSAKLYDNDDYKKIAKIENLLGKSDEGEKIDLTFSEMYNKALKEKMIMVMHKEYKETNEDFFSFNANFISKDGYCYNLEQYESASSSIEEKYLKSIYKYQLDEGKDAYKELKKLAK